jgi:hypothetical protein
MKNFLDLVGVNAGVIFAAFCGALGRIGIFGIGEHGPFATIFSVVGGTVSAMYLGPVAPVYFGWQENSKVTYALTFLIGMFAMEICNQLGAAIRRWSPTIKGTSNGT